MSDLPCAMPTDHVEKDSLDGYGTSAAVGTAQIVTLAKHVRSFSPIEIKTRNGDTVLCASHPIQSEEHFYFAVLLKWKTCVVRHRGASPEQTLTSLRAHTHQAQLYDSHFTNVEPPGVQPQTAPRSISQRNRALLAKNFIATRKIPLIGNFLG